MTAYLHDRTGVVMKSPLVISVLTHNMRQEREKLCESPAILYLFLRSRLYAWPRSDLVTVVWLGNDCAHELLSDVTEYKYLLHG